MLQPAIIKVKPLEDYKLYLEYENNEKKIFDVKPYFDIPFYKDLQNPSIFKTVKTVDNWTVEWINGKDISPQELYQSSISL